MNKTRPQLTMELNDQLWRRGWASFRCDRASSNQQYNCDMVAFKGGKVRFITIEQLKGGSSKTGVSSKIDNLKEMVDMAKPLSLVSEVNMGWVLAVYIENMDMWVGVDDEVTTVKASKGYEPIHQVL